MFLDIWEIVDCGCIVRFCLCVILWERGGFFRKVISDFNLLFVYKRMSLRIIELSAYMYYFYEFFRGYFKWEVRCLLLCKVLSFLDKKFVFLFFYLCLYFIYIYGEKENILCRSIFEW